MKTAWLRGDELVLTAALALLLWVSLSSARLMEADREKDVQSVSLLLLMPGSAVPITPPTCPRRPCLNLKAKEAILRAAPTYEWPFSEIVTQFPMETMQ